MGPLQDELMRRALLQQMQRQPNAPVPGGMIPRGPVTLQDAVRSLWAQPEEERYRVNEPPAPPAANPWDDKLGRN